MKTCSGNLAMQSNNITITAKQVSVRTLDKVFVWCIMMGAAFAKWYTVPGISLGDILVASILIILITRLFMGNFSLKKYHSLLYVALLWFWALGGALFLINASPFYFSEEEFAKSFLKLSFYGISTVFLLSYLRKIPGNITRNLLLNVLMINALIAIYIYLVMAFELSLPYKFFWFNQPEYISSYYRGTDIVVARGIFNEPSLLGVFQNLGLAYLLFSHNSKLKLFDWKYLIIILSILLSLSYIAYSLLVLNLVLYLVREKKIYLRSVITNLLLLVTLITVVATLMIPQVLEKGVVSRTFKIFYGMDDSANARILGSWEPALKFIKDSPFFAAGLGNFDIAQIGIGSTFRYMSIFDEPEQGFNIFAYVLGTLGVVGFCIFILFITDLIIHARLTGIVFVAAMFASGNFLDPSFWIFYCLFTIHTRRKKMAKQIHLSWGAQEQAIRPGIKM